MFKTFILTTLRGIRRDFAYAVINIGGLSVGVSCFIILALFLESELTYDRHFENHENIYRVVTEIENDSRVDHHAITSRRMAPLLAQDNPDIRSFVRFSPASTSGRLLLRDGDTKFYWSDSWLVDENMFEVFSHNILHGDPKTALEDPLSIAISETVAERYFGDENPIGKRLETDTAAYNVTLVFEDLPPNTHLKYDVLLSYKRLDAFFTEVDISQELWGISDYTYVVLPAGYDTRDFAEISSTFFQKYMAERGSQLNSEMRMHLEPLADVHLNSRTQDDRPRGSIFYVYTFSVIAVLVLLVACINYMNLATARSIQRSKEIGMRKILGASRSQLVMQFLGESLIFSFFSVALAVLIVHAVLTWTSIDRLLGSPIAFSLIERPFLAVPLLLLAIIVGLFSGLYPAFYLAGIQPIAALRGNNKGTGKRGGILRQALVFLQFAISVGVIACTLLMAFQMQFLRSKPLGYDPENVLIVTMIGADLLERVPFIKGDLASHPNIIASSISPNIPGEVIFTNLAEVERDDGRNSTQTIKVMGGDVDYLDVLGIELVHGRSFDPATPTEQIAYVNETMVKKMNWQEPLGKHIDNGFFRNRVVGVVRDFHFQSLHTPVEPLYIFYNWLDFEGMDALNRAVVSSYLYIRISDADVPGTLSYLQDKFAGYDPAHPFEYRFLDDVLDQQYASESRQMALIGVFSAVCILVSCLGLFGLSAFTTSQRTKEVGIRKVLGASNGRIILMLFKDMAGLILAAAIVASIIAYYVISNWLAGFAYKEDINVLVFVLAAAFCLAIAFATVSLQSLKTVRTNPGVMLRYEG